MTDPVHAVAPTAAAEGHDDPMSHVPPGSLWPLRKYNSAAKCRMSDENWLTSDEN